MFVHPDIDPVAVAIGPLAVHWYGLMYLLSFLIGWGLGIVRTKQAHIQWQREEVGDLLFYVVLGVVVGGRVGYMLFYQPGLLLENPLQLFYIWQGGMSFHGGMLGVFAAAGWFARSTQRAFFDITDFVAPIVPIGLFFGRIANFINGELIGRVTDVPWAMIYPRVDMAPRHPSELYEAGLEGLLLFAILWWFARKPRPRMAVSGLFLIGYGCLRFFAEFFRQPDSFLGFVAFDWMTMGQVLCTPMILGGILLLALAYKRNTVTP
ncbi:Prolipoprotein diacylglyceryl transferase [Salinisphaera shabanensis E1L3A]|uniref:Phosphatidylglycerol--prolipoprotein diacylglyceryl transferase n=1 Tax=Salinisphaera shabanensis E1L3A TaxID=1033802 RepID=U2ESX0_9GAMM|nr:prolipoprotein diacylglyceryl transferase [Salinisphaera shabanensis]ERJ20790.1 Prolipoprotein diacylglyceryl transferase [Salinisphaera shabanensis E1L3A]